MCGKECPPEMRAGNRKKAKPKKYNPNAGRVTFIPWYYTWWFIILATFFMPLLGIILLVVSPHSKKSKLAVVACGVAYFLLISSGVLGLALRRMNEWANAPTSATYEEYEANSRALTAEEFFRHAEDHRGEMVTLTLKVAEELSSNETSYNRYYRCTDETGRISILVRDCRKSGAENFLPGDEITLWGEGAKDATAYNSQYETFSGPTLAMAYARRLAQ